MRQLVHDIRNDINAAQLELTFLEESLEGSAKLGQPIRATLDALETRLRRLSAKFQTLDLSPAEVRAEDLAENIQTLAREENLGPKDARWEFDAAGIVVQADFDRLSEAVLEIVRNAAKFADHEEGPCIQFLGEGGRLRISVRERKKSVPVNLDSWGTALSHRGQGSYGLGLHQAERIVTAHGGQIERCYAESTHTLVTSILLPPLQIDAPPAG